MARGRSRKNNSKRAVSGKKKTANQHENVIGGLGDIQEGSSRTIEGRMEEMDTETGEKRGPSDSLDGGNSTGPTRSKRARLEDDGEGDIDMSDGEDQEDAGSLEVAKQGDLAELWEESVQTLRRDNVVPSSDVVELQSKLSEARLGGGLLRFCGVGDVHSVVDLSDDPNARGNPRPINMAHVDALHEIFQRPGAKHDHEAPAVLVTSSSLVDAGCLQEMKDKDPRDVAAILPCIRLVRQEATQEDELENRLWLCRIDGTSMTKEEILRDISELENMRKSRKRMKLLNGNHRFQAMLRLADDLYRRRDEINRLLDLPQEKKDPDLIRKMVEDLKQDVLRLTWRVEVYDEDKLTDELRNALVRNEDERPARGMGAGEKAWWTSEWFSQKIQEEMKKGNTREEAASTVAVAWQKEMGVDFCIGVGEDVAESTTGSLKVKKSPNEVVGPDVISKLFTESTCMEMVMATRSALPIWGNCLTRAQAMHMLKPGGASFVAHLWLSLCTLLKIVNVHSPEGLEEAREYVVTSPRLTAEGDIRAPSHWEALHARYEQTPRWLDFFVSTFMDVFDREYRKFYKKHCHPTRGIDYHNPNVILALREVFENAALSACLHNHPAYSPIQISMRAYARLPLWKPGSSGPCFYPWASLPGTTWLNELMLRWSKPSIPIDALSTLETLLSRYNVIWTVGALGNSKATNTANWYNRSRGLHQIVAHCYAATSFGPLEARLGKAIEILEDPRLRTALMSLKTGRDHRDLVTECCASKSSGVDYPILYKLYPAWPEYKSVEEMKSKLGKFRTALKNAIVGPNPSIDIPTAVQEHHISKTIHTEFWEMFDIAPWALGWGDTNREKEIKTTSALVGWGYLQDAFCERVLPRYMEEYPGSRWLLQTVRDVCNMDQRKPWWENIYTQSPPSLPSSPLPSRAAQPTQPNPSTAKPTRSSAPHTGGQQQRQTVAKGKGKAKAAPEPEPEHEDEAEPESDDLPGSESSSSTSDSAQAHSMNTRPLGNTRVGKKTIRSRPGDTVVSKMIAEVRPAYILTNTVFSNRSLQNLDGELLGTRMRRGADTKMDLLATQRISSARKSHPEFMQALANERDMFRKSVLEVGKIGVNMPYGYDFICTGLSSTMATLKDIFVARVALLFMQHMNFDHDTAINEAAAIASTDGLYDQDLATLADNDELYLNLRSTITKEAQDLCQNTTVHIGTPQIMGGELGNASDIMNAFRVARGYGMTEGSAAVAGIEAVAARAFVRKAKNGTKVERYWEGRDPISTVDLPTKLNACTAALDELILGDSSAKYDKLYEKCKGRTLTTREPASAFSTGQFVRNVEVGMTDEDDTMASALSQELSTTVSTLKLAWEDMVKVDTSNLKSSIAEFVRE